MFEYQYVIADNTVKVLGHEEEFIVYDFNNWELQKVAYYKSLLAAKKDMEYAKEYLNQMFFGESTSLIDGALINSAIQLLVRCFSNPSGKGRPNLNSVKVFRSFAKEIGEEDLTKQFSQFYDARNQIIAHDQLDYQENIIGLVVNQFSGLAEDIAELTIRTRHLYKNNQKLLLRMVDITIKYIEVQLNQLKKWFLEEYNKNPDKQKLDCIMCNTIPMATEW